MLTLKFNNFNVLLEYIQQLQKLNQAESSVEALIGSSGLEALSKREIQILEKLSRGCTDAEISESIFCPSIQ